MKKLLVFCICTAIALSACSTAVHPSASTPVTPSPSPGPTATELVYKECTQTDPILAMWASQIASANTLSVTALEAALDLYTNPRETGLEESEELYQQTNESYIGMQSVEPIPTCMLEYHNLVTEILGELSLCFLNLQDVYRSIDAEEDFSESLTTANRHLNNALQLSEESVAEWDSVQAEINAQSD